MSFSSELEHQEQLLKEDLDRINEKNHSGTNVEQLKKQIDDRISRIESLRNTVKDADFNAFKLRLEEEGMAKLSALQKQTGMVIPPQHKIEEVLQAGFNEFEKNTGRPMTYSEMREMYG
jgi:hypothetical protein